jgi:hypothetical protein
LSSTFILRIFKEWKWSFKKTSKKQIYKYSTKNIIRYFNFIKKIQTLDMHKLKYLDESHFESKGLQRQKGISPKGERCIVIDREIRKETFSLTLLSSIDPETENMIYLDMRRNSNTAVDFFNCIKEFVRIGNYLFLF